LHPRRRALIIGASSGIGAALARQLARDGYALALLARRADLLRELCAAINLESGETRAIPFTHDVTDFESVPTLLKEIVTTLGGLDLVIYNAGMSAHQGIEGWDPEKSRQAMEVNAVAAMVWLDPVGEMFLHLGQGQIVGISSVAGDRGRVRNPAYNASKAALTTYLEALRNRLTRHGVNVLTIKPGFVKTELITHLASAPGAISPEQAAEGIARAIRKRKQEVYLPARWRLIMFVIRNIPSFVFRRLNI
jgi:short-subunit dehydrogenase